MFGILKTLANSLLLSSTFDSVELHLLKFLILP